MVRSQNFGAIAGLCTQTANAALTACGYGAQDDFWVAIGNCGSVRAD